MLWQWVTGFLFCGAKCISICNSPANLLDDSSQRQEGTKTWKRAGLSALSCFFVLFLNKFCLFKILFSL